MKYIVTIVLLQFCYIISADFNSSCTSYRYSCRTNDNCRECTKSNPCCLWCSDKSLLSQDEYQCGISFKRCNGINLITNSETKHDVNQDHEADKTFNKRKTIQVRPQEFKIYLRNDEPHNITFTYSPVEHYPLDLYYLIDASWTMRGHIEDVKKLGDKLEDLLKKLTPNYKLALGIFMDKTIFPFIYTDKLHQENACAGQHVNKTECDPAFVFKHKQNFTQDIDEFHEQIKSVKTSANNDNLDGASIALMQVLNCEKYGWRSASRKQILMASDSTMHWAGDGFLGGAVKSQGLEDCLSEEDLVSFEYDYPSIEFVQHQLVQKKTKLIIAAPNNESLTYFRSFKASDRLLGQNIFVDRIEENNTQNILNLIENGYKVFSETVHFFVNGTATSDYLRIKLYSDCGTGKIKDVTVEGCSKVRVGMNIQYIVEFEKFGESNKKMDYLLIEESSLNEVIKLSLEYFDTCECNKNVTCVHGRLNCDKCECNDGYKGKFCNEKCSEETNQCRGSNFKTCSGWGECKCNECLCDPPYSGKFCEYSCPMVNGKLCNGQQCIDGVCKCGPNWTNEDCSCSLSNTRCQILGTTCMNNGRCVCNKKCECDPGFSGKYCEIDNKNNINLVCSLLEPCVVDYQNVKANIENCRTLYTKSSKVEGLLGDCVARYIQNERSCTVNFLLKDDGNTLSYGDENCYVATASSTYIMATFGLIVLIGLLLLLFWKCYTLRKDKIEYARFEKEQATSKLVELNPIYRSPISDHENPMYQRKND